MSRIPVLAAGLITAAFACGCVMFVWQPTLATFADDSVSYLVMAQVFSPYHPAAPAVAEAFVREGFYPPLFPLLLALGGAAHDFAWAHAFTALLLAAALPFAYLLGRRWLGSGSALAALACIALLPSLWINSKGILSESLFCLLLMKTFWVLDADDNAQAPAWRAAPVMAALALTRTAALPMIAVHALWALSRRGLPAAARMRAMGPAMVAIAGYGLWVLLRPSTSGDDYAHILAERGQGFLEGPDGLLSALSMSLLRQANAIVEGWAGSLMIFWIEGQPARFAMASAVGILALAGLALRIRRGKPDGWMMAAYLATLLAWPFYEQMERFLFPALPVLMLYAFLAAGEAMRAISRKPAIAHALLFGLVLSLSLPAMAFIRQRSQAAGRVALVTDWYRTPDLERARRRVQTHLDLFDDMQAIRSLTRPDQRVMWVAPSYIALLADRRALLAPDARLGAEAYREAVRNSGADYVFLSRYHPRDTIRDTAWQAGLRALSGSAKAVHTSTLGDGSTVTSVLFKAPK